MKKPQGGPARASALVEISLLLTVFFFGTNFVAVKLVVESVPPLLFAAVRFSLAGLLLLLVLRVLEGGEHPGRRDVLRLLGLGAVGVTLTQSFFTIGVGLTTAANTALVYSTSPIWGMLLGGFLGLERPGLRNILGVALALAGVGLVVGGGLELAGTSLVGDLCILGAAVGWGSYTTLSVSMLGRHSPLAVAAYPMLLGGLAIFPLSVLDLRVDVGAIGGPVWFAALYSLLFSGAFGFVAWQRGVSQVGANRVLVYQYLVTLTGVGAGVALLGEGFGAGQVAGALVLLAGVYLARRG